MKLSTIPTVIAIILTFFVISAPAENDGKADKRQVIEITATELWDRMKGEWKAEERPVLIDLRNAKDHARGFLTGSRQLDPESDDFDAKVALQDRERTYLIYCQDGTTSAKMLARWKDQKFKELYYLKGGWKAYEAFISGGR